jgi:hypothetical protein
MQGSQNTKSSQTRAVLVAKPVLLLLLFRHSIVLRRARAGAGGLDRRGLQQMVHLINKVLQTLHPRAQARPADGASLRCRPSAQPCRQSLATRITNHIPFRHGAWKAPSNVAVLPRHELDGQRRVLSHASPQIIGHKHHVDTSKSMVKQGHQLGHATRIAWAPALVLKCGHITAFLHIHTDATNMAARFEKKLCQLNLLAAW